MPAAVLYNLSVKHQGRGRLRTREACLPLTAGWSGAGKEMSEVRGVWSAGGCGVLQAVHVTCLPEGSCLPHEAVVWWFSDKQDCPVGGHRGCA
jgi:hypothetical protein